MAELWEVLQELPGGVSCTSTLRAALHLCCSWASSVRILPHTSLLRRKFFQHLFHGAGGFNSLAACEASAKVLDFLLTFGFPLFRVLDKAVSLSAGEGVPEAGRKGLPILWLIQLYQDVCFTRPNINSQFLAMQFGDGKFFS